MGLSFTYDGFGNRTAQTVTKGSGPSSSLSISLTTNRISSSGYSYNSNGNLKTLPYGTGTMTLTYDVDNRMEQAVNSNGTERYGYDHQNRRFYKKTVSGTQLIFFYGANGDRLRTYQFLSSNDSYQVQSNNIHFMGRLIRQDSTSIFVDRLGSVRNTSRYYPFGEEQGAGTIPDKFATYYRDSSTGLDYAHHRYYSSTQGRFTTPDPFQGSANPENPLSWNRYSYVENDPINKNDPEGLGPEFPERGGKNWWWVCYWSGMCGNPQGQAGPVSKPGGGNPRMKKGNCDFPSFFGLTSEQKALFGGNASQ